MRYPYYPFSHAFDILRLPAEIVATFFGRPFPLEEPTTPLMASALGSLDCHIACESAVVLQCDASLHPPTIILLSQSFPSRLRPYASIHGFSPRRLVALRRIPQEYFAEGSRDGTRVQCSS